MHVPRVIDRSLIILLLALALAATAGASQVTGHLYTASEMLAKDADLGAFLGTSPVFVHGFILGSLAPDSSWLSYLFTAPQAREGSFKDFKLPDSLSKLTGTLEDAHNNQSVEMCLNLLKSAQNKGEAAYALGWLSHWVTDSYVHALINRWGGYFYGTGVWRHKILEALECKHVLSQHAAALRMPHLSEHYVTSGAYGTFLTRAFAATYPDNPNFRAPNAEVAVEALVQGEALVAQGARWFYLQATTPPAELEQITLGLLKDEKNKALITSLVPLPTEEQYRQLLKPMTVTVEPAEKELVIKVALSDSKMYARFLTEWEQAVTEAVAASGPIMGSAVAYLKAHIEAWKQVKPEERQSLRPDARDAQLHEIAGQLIAINPNQKLDDPRPYAGAEPVNIHKSALNSTYDLFELYCDYEVKSPQGTIIAQGVKTKLPVKQLVGQTELRKLAEAVAADAVALTPTEAALTIPTKSDKYEYNGTVYLAEKPLAENVDFVTFRGRFPGGDLTGAGEVPIGDIFPVNLTIPAEVAAKPGEWRFVLVADKETIKEEDLPLIQASLDQDKFRFDVETISEKTNGNQLTAELQFTNLASDRLTGAQKLVAIRFPPGQAKTDLAGALGGLNKQLEAATAALDVIDKAMEKVDKATQQKLEAEMTEYQAELDKTTLSDEDKQKAFQKKLYEKMKAVGVDIEKELQGNSELKALEELSKPPFQISTPVTLRPVTVRLPVPAEWKDATDAATRAWRIISRTYERKENLKLTADSEQLTPCLVLTVGAGLDVDMSNDPETEKSFREQHAAALPQAGQLTVGDYRGPLVETTTDKEHNGTRIVETVAAALLTKGKVFMRVRYSVTATGYRVSDNKGALLCDGFPLARDAAEAATREARSAIAGIRIVRAA